MKKLYLAGLLLISICSSAQNNFIGLKAGTRTTWFSGPEFDYYPHQLARYSNRTFATGGLNFETFISRNFLLGIEFLYEPGGYKTVTEIGISNPPYTLTNKFYFRQFSIPLLLGGSFGKDLYGNIHAGLVPAFILNCEREETRIAQDGRFLGRGTVKMDINNSFDIGYLAGGHIGYKLNSRSKIQATIRYQGNFTKRVMDEYIFRENYRYSAISITAGYLYALTPQYTGLTDPEAREILLVKSKRQKRTGIILMGTGAALGIAGGFVQLIHEVNSDGFLYFDFTGATIAAAGGALLTTGLVINIRSNGLRQKAIGSIR